MAIEDYCVLLFFCVQICRIRSTVCNRYFFRVKLKFTSIYSLTKKNRICLFASELNSRSFHFTLCYIVYSYLHKLLFSSIKLHILLLTFYIITYLIIILKYIFQIFVSIIKLKLHKKPPRHDLIIAIDF